VITLDELESNSSCSPDKIDMNLENDEFSYDGDSDIGDQRRSKIKKRRSKKHHRKDKLPKSPSPRKGKRGGADEDDAALEIYHDSPVDSANSKAEAINRHRSKNNGSNASSKLAYQPLEQTRSDMSSAAQ